MTLKIQISPVIILRYHRCDRRGCRSQLQTLRWIPSQNHQRLGRYRLAMRTYQIYTMTTRCHQQRTGFLVRTQCLALQHRMMRRLASFSPMPWILRVLNWYRCRLYGGMAEIRSSSRGRLPLGNGSSSSTGGKHSYSPSFSGLEPCSMFSSFIFIRSISLHSTSTKIHYSPALALHTSTLLNAF